MLRLHLRMSQVRRLTVALIAVASPILLGLPAAPSADAHALICVITLDVSGSGPTVTLTAEVRYPDHDPVVGETLVGVAYNPTTGQVVPLSLVPTASQAGFWTSTLHLAPGGWKAEVDAVSKTRGLQSIGFAVGTSGAPSGVVSPDPLPASIIVPGAGAAADSSGLRKDPVNGTSPLVVAVAIFFLVLGAGIPLAILVRGRGRRPTAAAAGPSAVTSAEADRVRPTRRAGPARRR